MVICLNHFGSENPIKDKFTTRSGSIDVDKCINQEKASSVIVKIAPDLVEALRLTRNNNIHGDK